MSAKTVLHNFVGGSAVAPAEGRYEDLIDPSTGDFDLVLWLLVGLAVAILIDEVFYGRASYINQGLLDLAAIEPGKRIVQSVEFESADASFAEARREGQGLESLRFVRLINKKRPEVFPGVHIILYSMKKPWYLFLRLNSYCYVFILEEVDGLVF